MEGKTTLVVLMVSIILVIGCMGDDEVKKYGVCVFECMKEKPMACIFDPEVCIPTCAAKCAIHLQHNFHPTIAPQNYACNIACTFTQCQNYMMLNGISLVTLPSLSHSIIWYPIYIRITSDSVICMYLGYIDKLNFLPLLPILARLFLFQCSW